MPYFQQLLNDGGPIVYVLLGCLLLATILFLDRFFYCHRARIDTREFLRGLFNILKNNKVVEAIAICDSTPGPVSATLRAAICHSEQDECKLRLAVDEAALIEIPRLERNTKLLACIGQIAPVLGLLGTLISLMGIFSKMQGQGHFVETIQLAGQVRSALITSVMGLIVALAVQLFYFILAEQVGKIVLDMEKSASEMIYFLIARKDNPDEKNATDSTSASNNPGSQDELHGAQEKER